MLASWSDDGQPDPSSFSGGDAELPTGGALALADLDAVSFMCSVQRVSLYAAFIGIRPGVHPVPGPTAKFSKTKRVDGVDNGDMATNELPQSADIRIETSYPGADLLSIHITPAFAEEIATAFEDAGGHVTRDTDLLELSVPDVVQSVLQVAGPIAGSGAAVAQVLKQWWHRNDGKKATATFNGESISLQGMSTEQMAEIIDLAHQRADARWRQQFPDRFPDDSRGDEEIE